jgi:hypothetical protein
MGAQAKAKQPERDDQAGNKTHRQKDTMGNREMEQADRPAPDVPKVSQVYYRLDLQMRTPFLLM